MTHLTPGTKVDRLYEVNGSCHWVCGYRLFDPAQEFSSRKGFTAAKVKKPPSVDEALVVADGQYKPLRIKRSELRPHSADAIPFDRLFGSVSGQGVSLGEVERAEEEDLSIGLDYTEDVEE